MTAVCGNLWRRSSSLDEFEATMSDLLRPCRIAGQPRESYRTEIRHVRMRRLGLTLVRLGGRARVQVERHGSLALLQIPLAGSFASHAPRGESRVYAAGKAAELVAPSCALDLEFAPATRMLILDLRAGAAAAVPGLSSAFETARAREGGLSLAGSAGGALSRLAGFLVGEIEADPHGLQSSAFADRLEDCLLTALADALSPSRPAAAPAIAPSASAIPHYVQRAERFMADNLDQPITLDDIAAAAGTSARTLHRVFRSARGETPLGVLKALRLERVHGELAAGRAGQGDIARLALAFGFNHLGLFAAAYRARFGVLPSATARGARS
ncbi:AraC family transcriptional regulator [Azorhizobium sp. AG788]|uniref:helix-turn-helix transcriptional regulator n=1 Tax=Azorhizobium sp. AG788 TaxID=2183897 RepID=UPI003139034F